MDGATSKELLQNIESETKIYGYDPKNFNPFAENIIDTISKEIIPSSVLNEIFGDSPDINSSIKYDYRDYFKDDFILNQLDAGQISAEETMPKVKMPTVPDINSIYPYGANSEKTNV